jgi:phosphatidylglycerophosphatase A
LTSLPKPSPAQLLRSPVQALAFGFGAGLAPKAPGTFGTLVGIPFYWFMKDLTLLPYLGIVLVTFVVGIWFCEVAAKAMQTHDHPGIVWDEMVGYWLTMALAPPEWWWMLVGFVLFRFFDILKPWPVGWVDRRVRGGFGIMVDDIIAAIYAWICLQAAAYAIASLG